MQVQVLHGNSRGKKFKGQTLTFDLSNAKVKVADVNQDGKRDLADVAAGDRVNVQAKVAGPLDAAKPVAARHFVDKGPAPPPSGDEGEAQGPRGPGAAGALDRSHMRPRSRPGTQPARRGGRCLYVGTSPKAPEAVAPGGLASSVPREGPAERRALALRGEVVEEAEHVLRDLLAAVLLEEVRGALDPDLLAGRRDRVREPLARPREREAPGRESENATSAGFSQRDSSSIDARHLGRAGLVRLESARAAGTSPPPPSTPRSGTAPRRRATTSSGSSVVVAPWMIIPIGRSGFFSANSRHAMNPLLTRAR